MENNEGIFSLQEFSQLKDFCNNCAKEDKAIHEKRKYNPSYIPKEKKPEPVKPKKIPLNNKSNKVSKDIKNKNKINYYNSQYNGSNYIKNNFLKNIDDKDIEIILNHKPNFKNPNNGPKITSNSFKNRVNMFEPKK